MDKLCSQCQLAFQAKRVTARYCSPKCRKLAFQEVSVLDVPAVSGQSAGYKFKAILGQCHGCSTPNDPRECICCACIARGRTHKGLGVECKDYAESGR